LCSSTTPIPPNFSHTMVKPLLSTFVITMCHSLPYSSSMRSGHVDSTRLNQSLQPFLMTCLGKTGSCRMVSLTTSQVLSSAAAPRRRMVMTTAAALHKHGCLRQVQGTVCWTHARAQLGCRRRHTFNHPRHAVVEGLPNGRHKLDWDGRGEHTKICLLCWRRRMTTCPASC
jgi:hypothetical protein